MDHTIISWTPTNWITVFLMAAGGFIIIKALLKGVQMIQQKQAA